MDTHYQPLYRQATSLQTKFHDYTHTVANDPMTHILQNQIHGLTHDLATNKDPHAIDRRLRTIQTQLRQTQQINPRLNPGMPGQNPILSTNQNNFLNGNFEHLRRNVLQHPNFK